MTEKIVAYAAAHPDVTALHVWLADGGNNNCECAGCRAARPSDFYVRLLNDIDAGLSARGVATRIVFLVYVDLMWPPIESRLTHPKRFILMFAPITRSYLSSFAEASPGSAGMTPYVRNKLQFPKSAPANLAYLRAWRKRFRGDGFDFDYHLLWPSYADFNHVTLARVLHRDIRRLHAMGLHGFNSCQVQRQSFPHNLLMDVMAGTLWNSRCPFRTIVDSSFADAFGCDGGSVARFFERMSKLWKPFFEPVHGAAGGRARIRRGVRNVDRMAGLAADFRIVAERNRQHAVPAIAWSWKYADAYLQLLDRLLPAFRAYLNAAPDARKLLEEVCDDLWRKERLLHPALDTSTCVGVLKGRIRELDLSADQKGTAA